MQNDEPIYAEVPYVCIKAVSFEVYVFSVMPVVC